MAPLQQLKSDEVYLFLARYNDRQSHQIPATVAVDITGIPATTFHRRLAAAEVKVEEEKSNADGGSVAPVAKQAGSPKAAKTKSSKIKEEGAARVAGQKRKVNNINEGDAGKANKAPTTTTNFASKTRENTSNQAVIRAQPHSDNEESKKTGNDAGKLSATGEPSSSGNNSEEGGVAQQFGDDNNRDLGANKSSADGESGYVKAEPGMEDEGMAV